MTEMVETFNLKIIEIYSIQTSDHIFNFIFYLEILFDSMIIVQYILQIIRKNISKKFR